MSRRAQAWCSTDAAAQAPIRLNALVIENVRLSSAVLQERLITHYTQALIGQLYRVMGSLDVIGNPVGLFNNVSGGFVALWYEPYQGLVMHGNKELGLGIVRGASAFAKGAVSAAGCGAPDAS